MLGAHYCCLKDGPTLLGLAREAEGKSQAPLDWSIASQIGIVLQRTESRVFSCLLGEMKTTASLLFFTVLTFLLRIKGRNEFVLKLIPVEYF